MSALGDAFNGRRVLVTGHTGFKGSWLTAWLCSMGAEVSGYALDPPTDPSLFDSMHLERQIRHVVGDVRDASRLVQAVTAARPEVIFHLAARAQVLGAFADPLDTIETNVLGTANVLDAARRAPSVRSIVVITTDKVYDNPETGQAFVESDPLGGSDPYGASKAAAEIVTAAFRSSYLSPATVVATARAGNVIGGGDWAADRIVPDSVRALTAGSPIVVRNPSAVRPWQHVLEPISGYLWLAARSLTEGQPLAGAWNFGPLDSASSQSVRWLVDHVVSAWGSGSWEIAPVSEVPHEARLLQLDSSKARVALGWRPVWDAATAIGLTVSWYQEYYRHAGRAGTLVDEHILAYEHDARAAGIAWAATNQGRAR